SNASAAGRLSPEAAGSTISDLFDRHGRAVLGLCRLLLRDAHDAEDATQSTFLAAHGALLRGSVPRDGGAWITEIARNECRARIRERMKAPLTADVETLNAVPATGADPGDGTNDGPVHKALAALPERQRHAVVLHDVFGLRAREVATALGVSLTAVEALIFRARRQLRVRLRPVAGALTLPIGVRDTLSTVIPGFSDGAASIGVTAGGGLGAGLLAKLAAAPVAAKVTAAAVAVTAAGSVVAVEANRQQRPTQLPAVSATTADHVASSGAAPRGVGDDGGSGTASRASLTSGRAEDDRGRGDGEDAPGDRSGPSGPEVESFGPGDGSERHDEDETRRGPSPDDGDATRVESAERSSGPSKDDDASSSSEPAGDDDRSGPSGGSGSSSSEGSEHESADRSGSGSSSGPGSGSSENSGSGSSESSGSSGSGSGSSGSESGSSESDELEPDDD
ncbi:MAG: sigma-70 family RNA polymerase sigma factor, partial [Thermoleophilia bacterium]|nr:sigma-70 family RNA polymerase sigma factor [Thermoleophilia bacterium]